MDLYTTARMISIKLIVSLKVLIGKIKQIVSFRSLFYTDRYFHKKPTSNHFKFNDEFDIENMIPQNCFYLDGPL